MVQAVLFSPLLNLSAENSTVAHEARIWKKTLIEFHAVLHDD
jgi:hypothetical protein